MGAQLYRGVWPQNVSKLAKYAVRRVENEWAVTVFFEQEFGTRYLAVDKGRPDVVDMVNRVKAGVGAGLGGVFYVNEYRHVIVPVGNADATSVRYYFAGFLEEDFCFEIEEGRFTAEAVDAEGNRLRVGDPWRGPRPGIPYVLAAGGSDIYCETPVLTEDDPPRLIPRATRRLKLSRVLRNPELLRKAVEPIRAVKGHQGGRFYVNETGAIFSPVGREDGDGIDYVYCGTLDYVAWFPEPPVP